MAGKISLETVKQVTGDLTQLTTILYDDVESAIADKTAYGFRSLVRAVFASVEGSVSFYKQFLVHLDDVGLIVLTPEERSFLSEVSFDLDDRGQLQPRRVLIPLRKNVRFAFHMYAARLNLSLALELGTGWEAFGKAVKIRDRLMHPKTFADLQVSADERSTVMDGHAWFLDQSNSLTEHVIGWVKQTFRGEGGDSASQTPGLPDENPA